jgi:ABC-type lipoprotein release transport system permease subunit
LAGRALQDQLFQTPPVELTTPAIVASLLTAVAVIASVIPTARAVRLDTHSALRAE